MFSRLRFKQIALGVLLVALGAVAALAMVRELTPKPDPGAAAAFTGGIGMGDHHAGPALSVEEEAYAAALWPIHSEVKLSAVRMTFAGIAYKTQDGDARRVKEKVQPLTQVFRSAAQRARKIEPPQTLKAAHDDYLKALDLYATASQEMIRIADNGNERHLVAAHQRSEQASTVLIKLSDTLWPGEYKPN